MKLILEIQLGNDAMQNRADVDGAIRRSLTNRTDFASMREALTTSDTNILRDRNGNTVGRWYVVETSDRE